MSCYKGRGQKRLGRTKDLLRSSCFLHGLAKLAFSETALSCLQILLSLQDDQTALAVIGRVIEINGIFPRDNQIDTTALQVNSGLDGTSG